MENDIIHFMTCSRIISIFHSFLNTDGFFAGLHSSEGAAGGGGWGEESRRARASRRSEAEAGQFPSKKVRAKDIISPQIVTSCSDNTDARRDGRTARDNSPRRFAAKWLGGENSKRADLSVSYQNQI